MQPTEATDPKKTIASLVFWLAMIALVALIPAYFYLAAVVQDSLTLDLLRSLISGAVVSLVTVIIIYHFGFKIGASVIPGRDQDDLHKKLESLRGEILTAIDNWPASDQAIAERLSTEIDRLKEDIALRMSGKFDELLSSDLIVLKKAKSRLYTLQGLREELSTSAKYQDFDIQRRHGRNVNAVYYLWADSLRGNRISSDIIRDDGDSFLRVSFDNKPDSWSSDVAIRPMNEMAICNEKENGELRWDTLEFSARVPNDVPLSSDFLNEAAISIRLVDGNLTHWENASVKGCNYKHCVQRKWQTYRVDLRGKDSWIRFDADGNHLWHTSQPNFTVISGLIMTFGGNSNDLGLPGPGVGVVDIRWIRLA